MGKWIGIIVGLAIVLGVVGVVAVKTGWWATAKEEGEAWMDEQQLKNFPALARQELKAMEGKLEEAKATRKKLNDKINFHKGTDNMPEEVLTDESGGYATVKGYEILSKKKTEYIDARKKAISSIVSAVKKQQQDIVAASGGAIAKVEDIDAKQVYTVTKPNGDKAEYTLADARKVTDDLAKQVTAAEKDLEKYNKRKERLGSIVAKMEQTGAKLDKTIEAQTEKIKDMKIFIDDMEAELKLLEIEKDIAAINAAINGEESSSEFGKIIGKYKKAQKEFYASQGEVESTSKEVKGPSADDFMGTDSGSTSGGSSDSYWK